MVASAVIVLLAMWRTALAAHLDYPAKGYGFDYPDGWNVNQALLDVDGPVELTTYPAADWIRGGFLPPGGMDINIQVFPAGGDEMRTLTSGDQNPSTRIRSHPTIGNRSVVRLDGPDHFDPHTVYESTVLGVHVRGKFFKILLWYQDVPPDREERAKGEAALSEIVSTLTVGGGK